MFKVFLKWISMLVKEESGADMLEYTLVLTFVALACVAGVTKLGNSISNALDTTANTITSTL
jgi:Flp pilus assembly pilin Flp